jgi:hypothetical protein
MRRLQSCVLVQLEEGEAMKIERDWDGQARSAARRVGLAARKSRQHLHLNNEGGYMLVDPAKNVCVAGERFEFTAEDVIEFCREYKG